MLPWIRTACARKNLKFAYATNHPALLGSLPAICLLLYWTLGETALIACAVVFPVIAMVIGGQRPKVHDSAISRAATVSLLQRDAFRTIASDYFATARENGLRSACFVLELDGFEEFQERHGQSASDKVIRTTGQRLLACMRDDDAVAQTADDRFSLCIAPTKRLDLELCLQVCARVQAALEEPVAIDGTSVFVSASIGFCQISKVVDQDAAAWTHAAGVALRHAQSNGAKSIRAYSEEMRRKSQTRAQVREEVGTALENGQIQPWFQPQISTDTGLVTGFEALARWHHPDHGMVPPASFLPAIEQTGMLERLAEIMMFHAFSAVKAWDAAGLDIPQVGVNFAGPELNNPKLVDKVKWELDRFELAPERLAVEILETVVAGAPEDTTTRNIKMLGEMGCRIDLDDFGTGQASIASIRRFAVSRIKIDRSFVIKADRDPEQQRIISAILTMAERLNVETLAEGVETVGEHALLAQLGCSHVQGFGIARPMPFDKTIDWVRAHNAKLETTPNILGSRFG